MSETRLNEALKTVGADEAARRVVVQACVEAEERLRREGFNVREEVTGPIVDALYGAVDQVRVTLSDGTLFEVPYRSKIARDLVMRTRENPDHVFEPQTTKLLLLLSRGARNVIIGGAYSGDHAILAAKLIASSGGVVHAFEPNPEQMRSLVHNAEINGVKNIRFNERALWERSDVRLKLVGDDAFARTEETSRDDRDGLDVTTIDEYVRERDIDGVDVIMLDIEGGELPVLRGARNTLSAPDAPSVIYEVNNAYVDWSDGLHETVTVKFLADLGYSSYGIRDYQSNVDLRGYPVELVPVESAYIGGPRHGFNVLAVKNGSIVDTPEIKIAPGLSPKLLHHRNPEMHAPNR